MDHMSSTARPPSPPGHAEGLWAEQPSDKPGGASPFTAAWAPFGFAVPASVSPCLGTLLSAARGSRATPSAGASSAEWIQAQCRPASRPRTWWRNTAQPRWRRFPAGSAGPQFPCSFPPEASAAAPLTCLCQQSEQVTGPGASADSACCPLPEPLPCSTAPVTAPAWQCLCVSVRGCHSGAWPGALGLPCAGARPALTLCVCVGGGSALSL